MLAAEPEAFFTIPHFDGYAAVLIQLKSVTKRPLREAIVDGWLACAPTKLADGVRRAGGEAPPLMITGGWRRPLDHEDAAIGRRAVVGTRAWGTDGARVEPVAVARRRGPPSVAWCCA